MKQRNDQRPIVCGTDFSGTATEAMEIAAAMARRLGTELILVHVDEFYGLAPVDPKSFEAALSGKSAALHDHANRLRTSGTHVKEKLLSGSAFQKNLERDLNKRIATLLPKQKVNAIVEPGWGTPEGYLFEMASREHVDLIVLGTHQRQGLGRVLLGSVSRAVLHHAKVAVAVVPPAETPVQSQRK